MFRIRVEGIVVVRLFGCGKTIGKLKGPSCVWLWVQKVPVRDWTFVTTVLPEPRYERLATKPHRCTTICTELRPLRIVMHHLFCPSAQRRRVTYTVFVHSDDWIYSGFWPQYWQYWGKETITGWSSDDRVQVHWSKTVVTCCLVSIVYHAIRLV